MDQIRCEKSSFLMFHLSDSATLRELWRNTGHIILLRICQADFKTAGFQDLASINHEGNVDPFCAVDEDPMTNQLELSKQRPLSTDALLIPQSNQRIHPRRAPRRDPTGHRRDQNQEDHDHRDCRRIAHFGAKQEAPD
jgi:hypothetical protein